VRGISITYAANTLGKCTNLAPFPPAPRRVLPRIALVGTNRRCGGLHVQEPSLNVISAAICTYHLGLIIVQNVSITDAARDVAAVRLHVIKEIQLQMQTFWPIVGKHKHTAVIASWSFRAANRSRSRCGPLGDDGDNPHCLSLSKVTDEQRDNPSFPELCTGHLYHPLGLIFP